jgi:hypothetical protein
MHCAPLNTDQFTETRSLSDGVVVHYNYGYDNVKHKARSVHRVYINKNESSTAMSATEDDYKVK